MSPQARILPACPLCAHSYSAGYIHHQTNVLHCYALARGISFYIPRTLRPSRLLRVGGCNSWGSPLPPAATACAGSYPNAAAHEQPSRIIRWKEGLRQATRRSRKFVVYIELERHWYVFIEFLFGNLFWAPCSWRASFCTRRGELTGFFPRIDRIFSFSTSNQYLKGARRLRLKSILHKPCQQQTHYIQALGTPRSILCKFFRHASLPANRLPTQLFLKYFPTFYRLFLPNLTHLLSPPYSEAFSYSHKPFQRNVNIVQIKTRPLLPSSASVQSETPRLSSLFMGSCPVLL